MKIKPEHLEHLRVAIANGLATNADLITAYEEGHFPGADKVKDLNRRFRFDMLYRFVPSAWVCDELYPYLNDDHIHTALKAACPTLTRRY